MPSLEELLLTRVIDIDLYIDVTGHGMVSIPVRTVSGQIYIEGVYMGSVINREGFIIPSKGTRTIHLVFRLDLSDVSIGDVKQVFDSIMKHEGEAEIKFEGYVEPIIFFIPITVPLSQKSYFLLTSPKPAVLYASWDSPQADIGEIVTFNVAIKNPYRGTKIEGELKIVVIEDVKLGPDKYAEVYDYTLTLTPNEEKSISGSFKVYSELNTRGFFLKVLWNSEEIYTQQDTYPPRLKVVKGTLEVINYYWEVDNFQVNSVEVGDQVIAHVIVKAMYGNFQGNIKISIRKDYALLPDVEYVSQTFSLYLSKDEIREFTLVFVPDEPSSTTMRGYFLEVEFNGESWTMLSDYPPRLKVTEKKKGTLKVLDAEWRINGREVTSANVGELVEIWLFVKAVNGPFNGSYSILIKEDLVGRPDVVFGSIDSILTLKEGETRWIHGSFIPKKASSVNFRGYFIELIFDSNSWTMDSSYPPRLKVYEGKPTIEEEGSPSILSVWWTVDGIKVTEASVGSIVVAHVKIKAVNGRIEGTVRVRIRKDRPLMPDEDYKVKTFDIKVSAGNTVELKVSFSPDEASGLTLRGYFVQVDLITWDSSWTMESSYPPRLKVS